MWMSIPSRRRNDNQFLVLALIPIRSTIDDLRGRARLELLDDLRGRARLELLDDLRGRARLELLDGVG